MGQLQSSAIHIFTAIDLEARYIRKALRRDGSFSVEPRPIGIRAVDLPATCDLQCAQCVILAGFAGALDPSLRIGDVVLDCPPGWIAEFNGHRGSICCSPHIVSTPQQKSELFRRTGALAVDMESEIVRARAVEAGIPLISIRAISDSADQSLNPSLLKLIDPLGRPKPIALAKALLRRPALMADLLQLRSASSSAGESLGEAVARLLPQLNAKLPNLLPTTPHAHLSDR